MIKQIYQIVMHCGTPMVLTIMFPDAEYYCGKCGISLGLFEASHIDESTKLLNEFKKNERAFNKIAGSCIAPQVFHDRLQGV